MHSSLSERHSKEYMKKVTLLASSAFH
jgi:hypothetical protein